MDSEMECTLSTMENMSSETMIQILDATYVAVQPTIRKSSVVEFKVHRVDSFIELN